MLADSGDGLRTTERRMHVTVNDARLYFDVDGPGLVPDGAEMRQKPTLILLHGGPGADHSLYKPQFGALTDIAQVIYLDHRGNGRSDPCGPETWNLAQWGDDVRSLCDALGIEKPIVLGTSFGGFVAQAYATRHPDHVGKLILVSTAARFDFDMMFDAFEQIGGAEARKAAEDYWLDPDVPSRRRYAEICLPLYFQRTPDPDMFKRIVLKDDVALWFNGPKNEQGRMDFRDALGRLTCPVLVLAGQQDPITPVAFSEAIAAALPHGLGQFERFADAGHGVVGDVPNQALDVIRGFIAR